MKRHTCIVVMASVICCVSTAFAASGAEYEGNSLLITLFLGLGALVVAFQFIPGLVLLGSMVKGVVAAARKAPVAVRGGGN